MINTIVILIKLFVVDDEPEKDEEATPISIEMFCYRIKVINQNKFVLICNNAPL